MGKLAENKELVDLVYLWCDDSDEIWHNKRVNFLSKEKGLDKQAIHQCRFENHDELKYSLRSVAKYASWINKIFIISDHQVPKWLNLKNPKIKIINHEDILPKENLPTFNSRAIETGLGNIPGLSERFLYANDDNFFGNYVDQDFFFKEDGKAIIRFSKSKNRLKTLYARCIVSTQDLARKWLKVNIRRFPHHSIDAYLKSDYQDCMSIFPKEVDFTRKGRFRRDGDLQRIIVSCYMIAKGHAVTKIVKDIDSWLPWKEKLRMFLKKEKKPDSIYVNIFSEGGLAKIAQRRPKLFCVNDVERDLSKKIDVKSFFEKMFPDKSEFEI